MLLRQFFSKHTVSLYVVVLVMFQLLIAFQGFDVCDEGFSLTFYQQFFNAPTSVEYNFAYWLSGLVGGLWYQLFPEGGILWFRLLAILFNTSTLILSYKLLKPYVNKQVLLVALAMVLFINDYGFIVFYHNTLTAFLVVLSAYYLIRGLERQSLYLIGLSAFICAINIFSRLPNTTMLIALLVVPYYGVLNGDKLKASLKKIAVYISGAILGVAFIVLLLYVLGQTQIMRNAIESILNSGSSSASTHSFSNLFEAYWDNIIGIVWQTLKWGSIVVSLIAGWLILPKIKPLKLVWFLVGAVLFALLFSSKSIYTLYGLTIIGGYIGLTKLFNHPQRHLVLLAILIAVFLPFGSDRGIWNSGYMSIWLGLPIAMDVLHKSLDKALASIRFKKEVKFEKLSVALLLVTALGYFSMKSYNIAQQAYFDPGSRLDKTFTIHSKFAKGIYTTEERAKVINELLPQLQEHVQPNDALLAYQSLPMLHFLTETKPYLRNPWVWIYDGEIFENQLKEAQKHTDKLPVVVVQKFETLSEFSAPIPDYFSEEREDTYSYSAQRTKAMNAFLKANDYKLVWSNAYFNIYKAK